MCGIVGFSGSSPFDTNKIEKLLLCNMSRGTDATGIYNRKTIIKEAKNAILFLAENSLEPELKFIGHCRAGTVGSKTDNKNAHPFEYGEIVGVHNGTLRYTLDLAKIVDWTGKDWDVDSQILIKGIADNKHIEMFKSLDGAAALIWSHKEEPSTIYCYRNDERPLFRGHVEEEGMYLSSIEESLQLIGCTSIKEIKPLCIYKITNGDVRTTSTIVIPPKKSKTTYGGTTYGGYNTYPKNDFIKDQWVKLKYALAGFSTDKFYKVAFVNGTSISLLDDHGKYVEKYHTQFVSTYNDVKSNNFVVFEERIRGLDTFKYGELLYCKYDKPANKEIGVVKLDNNNKVYYIPAEWCRGTEYEEEEAAKELLKKLQNVTAMGIKEIDEATNIFVLDDTFYVNSNNIMALVVDVMDDVESLKDQAEANAYIEAADVAIELEKIHDKLLGTNNFIMKNSLEIDDDGEDESKTNTDVVS